MTEEMIDGFVAERIASAGTARVSRECFKLWLKSFMQLLDLEHRAARLQIEQENREMKQELQELREVAFQRKTKAAAAGGIYD